MNLKTRILAMSALASAIAGCKLQIAENSKWATSQYETKCKATVIAADTKRDMFDVNISVLLSSGEVLHEKHSFSRPNMINSKILQPLTDASYFSEGPQLPPLDQARREFHENDLDGQFLKRSQIVALAYRETGRGQYKISMAKVDHQIDTLSEKSKFRFSDVMWMCKDMIQVDASQTESKKN